MSSTNHEKAILMTDSPKVVKNKINKYAFSGGRDTIEEHRKFGGNPDIDVAYQWLLYLEENDGELKQILIDKINNYLAKHQERRSKITQKDIDKFIYKI